MEELALGWPRIDDFMRDYAPIVWTTLIGYLLIINYATYLLFKFDKARSIDKLWRVSEETLLLCAFFGGTFGAKFAQRRFRHKTRKEPFRTNLNLICVLHVILAAAALVWVLGYWPTVMRWVA